MSTISDTIRELSEVIGPRPACSDSERSAAEYLDREFKSIGLTSHIQDFYSSTGAQLGRGLYSLIFIIVFALLGIFRENTSLAIPLLVLLIGVVVTSYLELNGIIILTRLFRKGPSQNVVAHFTPRNYSGSGAKKIVVLAHYDSCVVTPLAAKEDLFSPIAAANRYIFIALPILSAALLLPKFSWLLSIQNWIFYILLAVCIVPLIIFIDALASVAVKKFSPGANNNASGVAAMIEAARSLTEGQVSPPEHHHGASPRSQMTDFGRGTASSDSAVKQEDEEIPDDFAWMEHQDNPPYAPARGTSARVGGPSPDTGFINIDSIDFGVPSENLSQETVSFAPVSSYDHDDQSDNLFSNSEVLGSDIVGSSNAYESSSFESFEEKPSFFSRIKGLMSFSPPKKKKRGGRVTDDDSLSWLGLDDDFNARKAGKDIGNWDNFEGDDDDGFAWKGGAAGGDFEGDSLFASEQAALIRAKITERIGGSIDDKEIWFVATGAQCQNSSGMKAFLDEYEADIRDAHFINIDAVGIGALHWRVEEGRNRLIKASPRLISLARRVSRNQEIRAKAARRYGVDTDVTQALRQGFKGITITRLGDSMAPVNRCSVNDRLGGVDIEAVEETSRFVQAMVKEI